MTVRLGRYKFYLLHKRSRHLWYIYRNRPPYCCLSAGTKLEAIQSAGRAMQFYKRASAALTTSKGD